MVKRILSLAMSFLLIANLIPPSLAAGADTGTLNIQHSYTNNGYTFEKISHASDGTESPDGVVDYLGDRKLTSYVDGVSEPGNGDSVQSYSYCAATYGDWIYMGTMYGALSAYSQVKNSLTGSGISEDAAVAVIDAMYNGMLNKGREDDGYYAGSVFFKFNVKTGETKILMSRDLYYQGKCDGVPIFRNACEYNGKLYFVGLVSNGSALEGVNYNGYKLTKDAALNLEIMMQTGIPGIYEVDPATDAVNCVYECVDRDDYLTLCASMDQAQIAKSVFTSTRAIGTYHDYLIAGGIQVGEGDPVRADGYMNGEAVIYATNDPASHDFKVIATMDDLYNYPAIWRDGSSGGGGIYQVIEYNDSLYVAMVSGTKATQDPETKQFRPFAVVRGDYDASKGAVDDANAWTWTPVIGDTVNDNARYTFGIDPERTASSACTLQAYGGYLYIGEYNDVNGSLTGILTGKQFSTLAANLKQSINLYRMDADENIELVVGDRTKMFPKGSISGWGSGYETHMSQYTWQTTEYDGVMYLSTMDETSLLRPIAQFTNGDLLHMSREEWISQFNYLRVLLQLILNPNADSETMSVDEADALVTEAEQNADAAALSIADQVSTLTSTQRETLADLLTSGQLKAAQNTEISKMTSALNVFAKLPFQLAALLDTTQIQEFYDGYVSLLDSYMSIRDLLPESVQSVYDLILSFATRDNFVAMLTCLKYMKNSKAGFDLYAIRQTDDGVEVSTVTNDGFGDRYNHGLRIFATTNDYLAVGTANPFLGTQLWRMSATPTAEYGKHVCPGAAYTDMPEYSNWAHEGLDYCIANNLMRGMDDTTIAPELATTRAQIVTILWRQANCPQPATDSTFQDLTQDWYKTAVAWAAENGVVNGRTAEIFDPDAPVSRQEMATILYRYTQNALKQDVSGSADLSVFPDSGEAFAYAVPALSWAYAEGLISGSAEDGAVYLRPLGETTRAQAAAILMRFCKNVAT